MLTAAGLIYSGMQSGRAELSDNQIQDNGQASYKDLDHGTYVLTTKEPNPRTITVDNKS